MSIIFRLFVFAALLSAVVFAKGKGKRKNFQISPTSTPTSAFIASCRQFQNTEATVEAFFEDGVDVQRVYITDLVTLDSSEPEVASISKGNKIHGLAAGNATVSVNLPNDKVIVTPDQVEVSTVSVNLISLQISAITDATSTDEKVKEKSLYGQTDVGFALSQVLTFDGMSAGITVHANFSDGSYMDISDIAIISSLNSDLTTSDDAYGPLVTVNDFALQGHGEWIEAAYPVCYRQADAVNTGYVMLDIVPVRVDVIPHFHDLAEKDNLAAFHPFFLPQMTFVQVAVHFEDGSVRNMTDGFLNGLNTRCQLDIIEGGDLISVTGNLVRVRDGVSNGTAYLKASFPDLYNITGIGEIVVAAYEGTSVALTTFPSNPGIIKDTVYLLGCTDKRQRLQIMSLGTLTNSIIMDVTSHSGFNEADDNDIAVGYTYMVGNYTLFVGNGPGTIWVAAVYDRFKSFWTPIHVVEEHTHINRIEMHGRAPNDTLRGYSMSYWDFMKVTLYFDDGTYYPEVLRGVTTQWVNASELIWLNSSQPSAATVDEFGVVQLVGNYYDKIFFQAFDNCTGSTITDQIFAYSNVVPRAFDFDMGSKVGPKYGIVLIDSPFVVPIGVQSRPGLPVTTFHMVMRFDPNIITVPNDDDGCLMDESWTGFFECTTNNPPGEVHIAGICGQGGCDADGLVEFAKIDFQTITVGMSLISGEIVRSGDSDDTISNTTILAGTDNVVLATATPSLTPTFEPSGAPSSRPSSSPTSRPTSIPTAIPTIVPTSVPTAAPTSRPTSAPSTVAPTRSPTFTVTARPTAHPTAPPTAPPTAQPSVRPTLAPSARPTKAPTRAPSRKPTKQPTAVPTHRPTTGRPSKVPTLVPTRKPTRMPTSTRPTRVPTVEPTEEPTLRPTLEPTLAPTESPTLEPTPLPSVLPTLRPTKVPTVRPTLRPSKRPTASPTRKPTNRPTTRPTAVPSTAVPTAVPTARPTTATPTRKPTKVPTARPTTYEPTFAPSGSPTTVPTSNPTSIPTSYPTSIPTNTPVRHPTSIPTSIPSSVPTLAPTRTFTPAPTLFPRAAPTYRPTNTKRPTRSPTFTRTRRPSGDPTSRPTSIPTSMPIVPTGAPSSSPSFRPTSRPSPSPTSIPTSIPTVAPTSSTPSGTPSLMPTLYVKSGYNFTRGCGEPALGSVDVDLSGTEEICSDLPAFGDVTLVLSSLRGEAHESGYTPKYVVVVTDPLGLKSYRFGEQDFSLVAYPYLSDSTINSEFKQWDVEYDFSSSGAFVKGTLDVGALGGIGLFKVCLVNIDPADARTTVSYSGSLLFSKTIYDCDIPLSGFVESANPTGQPSSRPSEAPPTALPTSAPSFGALPDGINFMPQCDAPVSGEINIIDLPYMREGCGYFPGRGVEDLVTVDLFFTQLFDENPVHVIIQDLNSDVSYRYGDSFVNISGAADVSKLSKNAQFIPFSDGMDVGLMKSRKIRMPMGGFEAISGEGWVGVCLVNTGFQTMDEVLVTGSIGFLNYYVDCDVMFTQQLILPNRRRSLWSVDVSDSNTPVAVNLGVAAAVKLPNSHHEQHAADLLERLEGGDNSALMAHLQTTRDMFDENAESYHLPSKQNSLQVLQQLEEEDFDTLYARPVTITFEFAPRMQEFVVPAGTTTVTVYACGGSGGSTARNFGGLGGCISTVLTVRPKTTLFITVGGEGQSHGVAGFHGGGIGSSATLGFASESNNAGGAGGGGASEVRLNNTDIFTRLVVAGGGGGGGGLTGADGGAGGGLVGGSGSLGDLMISDKTFPPAGGNQKRGGAGGRYEGASCSFNEGYLGNGGVSSLGGGGGGGYYGGGGGCYGGGAGGSNHAVGSIVSDIQGVHEGPGFVRLTYNQPTSRDIAHSHRFLKKSSTPVVTNNGMVNEPQECGECVMGDVNQDCLFDAQDARELEQIVSKKRYNSPHYEYSTCQRRSMDPNNDGSIDVIDVQYLLRVTTKRYRFFTGLTVEYNENIGLNIEALITERDGTPLNGTLASVSVGMVTYQGPELELTHGVLDPEIQYPWGVQITPAFDEATGLYRIHSDYIGNEDGMALVVTIGTFDDFGNGHASRTYTFYCSPLKNGACFKENKEVDYVAYFTFNIWGMPTRRPTAVPTISFTPTSSPTGEPSGQPSGQPTGSPTIMKRVFTATEHLVHPHIDLLSGTALPMRSFPTPTERAIWSVPFNTVMGSRPGSASTFGLSISGRQYSTSSITAARHVVAAVTAVVKTPQLYMDSRSVGVAFQARDAFGGSQVEVSTPFALLVTHPAASLSTSFVCLSVDAISGIGACTGEIPLDWWAPAAAVTLTTRVTVLTDPGVVSSNGTIDLLHLPTPFTVGDALAPFVLLALPARPVVPGETIDVEISADTNAQSLTEWLVSLTYDSATLLFLGFSAGPAYTAPALLHSAGRLVLSANELSPNASLAALATGSAVELGVVQMRVLANATTGTRTDVLSAVVLDAQSGLMDIGIPANSSALVQDHRGFHNHTSGELLVQSADLVGLLAYTEQNELLNTAGFTGLAVHSAIVVEGIKRGADSANEIVTSSAQCSTAGDADAALDIVGQCVVQLSTTKGIGAAQAIVDVSYGGHNATVPFRVWYPSTLAVQVTDPFLQRIEF